MFYAQTRKYNLNQCKHSLTRICAVPRTSIPLRSISVVGLRPMLCYPNSLMRKRLAIFVAQRTALSFHVKRKSPAMKSITARDEVFYTRGSTPLTSAQKLTCKSHFFRMITVSCPCCSSQPLRGGLQTLQTKKLAPTLLSLKIFPVLLFSSMHL